MSDEKVKKPRTEKQLAATAALVARNKAKKQARAEQKEAEKLDQLEKVNLRISQISGDVDSDSDVDAGSDLEAVPQKPLSESSDSESSYVQSSSDYDSESSDDTSEEEKDEDDETPDTNVPQDYTSELPDKGYMTEHEKEAVTVRRSRPLNKGLLYRGW